MSASKDPTYTRLRRHGVSREVAASVAGITLSTRGRRDLQPHESKSKGLAAITFHRLMNSTVIDPRSGCWIWTGGFTRGRGGVYGTVSYHDSRVNGKRSFFVHRLSIKMFTGKLSARKPVDHKCRRTLCWNPDHLEQVTHSVNAQRRTHANRARVQLGNLMGQLDTTVYRKHGVVVKRLHDSDSDPYIEKSILTNAHNKTGVAWQNDQAESKKLPAREKRAA